MVKTMRRFFLSLALILGSLSAVKAQTGHTGYEFMNIPTSAHSAALGGNNVSIIEDDATLLFSNPALLSNVSDKTLNLNYMSYMQSSNKLSAAFVKQYRERGTWSFAGQVINYGKMKETTADFEQIGEFSASDIAVQAGYTYMLTDRWSGGVQVKALLSNYGEFKSTAIASDIGLNYFDGDNGISFGLVAQNLGGEVDPLYDKAVKLPFNLVAGMSFDFSNAPIRLSFTMQDLTHWDKDYYAVQGEKLSSGKRFLNHFALGADIFPSSQTWLSLGYSFRRGYEMKVLDSSHWAGFSLGAGLNVKKIKIGLAYAKYHVSSSSFMVNLSYSL
jgi:hypothetical protein